MTPMKAAVCTGIWYRTRGLTENATKPSTVSAISVQWHRSIYDDPVQTLLVFNIMHLTTFSLTVTHIINPSFDVVSPLLHIPLPLATPLLLRRHLPLPPPPPPSPPPLH